MKGQRFLLACHTRCKCSMENTCNPVKVKPGIKVMKSVKGWEVILTGPKSECHLSKIEVQIEGCSKLKRYVDIQWQVQERMVSTLEQMQVPNGTGPCVRRSKRPLLASRTRCSVLWKPSKFGYKFKIGNNVQYGNKFAYWCNVWSIEGVIHCIWSCPRMSCNIWERETS